MELGIPCYSCTSVYGKPALNRKTTTPKTHTYHFNPSKFRRKTTSELQTTPVEVTGRAGNSYPASIPTHKVTVHDRQRGVVHEFVVPEDQYILHTAESQNISLPFACRHEDLKILHNVHLLFSRERVVGCGANNAISLNVLALFLPLQPPCTAEENLKSSSDSRYAILQEIMKLLIFLLCCCTSCAVRIKSGEIRQPNALGISAELKSKASSSSSWKILMLYAKLTKFMSIFFVIQGYALLCVGFPTSDLEVETQDEDEVYWLQFGRYFARGPIDRDDYALELAMGDE
ncbi:hypothetical protein FEM48_Zijuj11G0084800 [Ziziphus jujuba var. spinosa]|uniref:Uncharacterized protein n=1 Tax=Ziziphus jujuba var. spinosa TaxID=714518 RepID=A0A978UHW0_ZIZJJ|nr:hypothetical protein FEM48_Zijuj11G0084800 [Ziziphus jujuba var. spinosa]